eukprot:2045750-Rhodomonas_salina.1
MVTLAPLPPTRSSNPPPDPPPAVQQRTCTASVPRKTQYKRPPQYRAFRSRETCFSTRQHAVQTPASVQQTTQYKHLVRERGCYQELDDPLVAVKDTSVPGWIESA